MGLTVKESLDSEKSAWSHRTKKSFRERVERGRQNRKAWKGGVQGNEVPVGFFGETEWGALLKESKVESRKTGRLRQDERETTPGWKKI